MSGISVQAARPIVTLVTLPVLLGYLGDEGLGVWFIALSFIGIINFVSAGLSASVITHVGRLSDDANGSDITQLATAGFITAAICAAVMIAVVLPFALLLNWGWLLGLEDAALGFEVKKLMGVIILTISLSFIAIIPRHVMFGRMHGYLAHVLDFSGVVIGATGLVTAVHLCAPLWALAAIFSGTPLVLLFFGGLIYMRRFGIKPFAPKNLDRSTFQKIKADTMRMSVYHVAFSISSQTDILLIGIILGAPAAAVYGVAQRAFSTIIVMCLAISHAQWPAMARLDALRDAARLSYVFRRTLLLVPIGSAILAAILLSNYQQIIELWLGSLPVTDRLLLWGMFTWTLVSVATNICDMLLRAQSKSSLLMRHMMIMAIVNVAVTLVLLPHFGAAGAVWGSVIAYLSILLVPYLIILRPYIIRGST